MKLRDIDYVNEVACINDLEQLRPGGVAGGNWTFEQACWHLNVPLSRPLQEPKSRQPAPEQMKLQAFVDQVVATGWPADNLPSPPSMSPPENVGGEIVDTLIASLRKLQAYTGDYVDTASLGPLPVEKYRRFVLVHAAHHLAFFKPKT